MKENDNVISNQAKDTLLGIAKCDIFLSDSCDKCKAIRNSSSNTNRYLPIPWQGHIEQAKILFVSSNPSVLGNQAMDEMSFGPRDSWLRDNGHEEKIVDFYEARFDQNRSSKTTYSSKGIYYLCENEEMSTHWVRYWASVRKRASELLEKSVQDVVPGQDYAITEIVHCQSNSEDGVADAKDTCVTKCLDRVLSMATQAKIIVLLGTHVMNVIIENSGVNLTEYYSQVIPLGNLKRAVIALPHPNARGKRKRLECEEIRKIRDQVNSLHW